MPLPNGLTMGQRVRVNGKWLGYIRATNGNNGTALIQEELLVKNEETGKFYHDQCNARLLGWWLVADLQPEGRAE